MGDRVGILAAMAPELDAILDHIERTHSEQLAGRTFHCGAGVVAVVSGIGKTAVASTTTLLIHHFGVRHVVLTGVAGRLSTELSLGDVVIATGVVHHDLDARPLFPRYHVPGLGIDLLATDAALSSLAYEAAQSFLRADGVGGARAVRGLVLSGDQFLGADQIAELAQRFPDGLAVEMEGAAVVQVCSEAGIPCAIVRSISDDGDAGAFARFLERDCGRYASGIISRLLASMR